YKDTDIIPKNASLVIARVPKLNTSNMSRGRYAKNKKQESSAVKQMISDSILPFKSLHTNQNDSKLSEEEKLKAVIFGNVSSNTVNNSKMVQGTPSDSYTCYRCRNKGHYIQFCPKRDNNKLDLNDNPKLQNHIQATKYLKTNHGIPSSFMTKVSDPSIVGARRLIDGTLGVNIKDSMALIQGCKEKVPFSSEEKGNSLYLDDLDSKFSNEMLCPICQNLFDSAVVTPCCGHSFCDFCIRSHLLENPESKCFHCSTKIDPEQLIKNTFLQNTVNRYKLEIGRISNQLNKPVVTNVSEASAEYTKLEDLVKSSSETLEQVVERQIEQISRLLKGNYVPQTGFQKKFYSRQLLNLFHGDSSDYSDEDYVRCYSVRQTLLDSMENSVDKDKKSKYLIPFMEIMNFCIIIYSFFLVTIMI
ncbi:MAG: E3 ubiquitin-protein ligase rbbp6, partial [Paramarteilia canceri]